jgi:hypothetical protein
MARDDADNQFRGLDDALRVWRETLNTAASVDALKTWRESQQAIASGDLLKGFRESQRALQSGDLLKGFRESQEAMQSGDFLKGWRESQQALQSGDFLKGWRESQQALLKSKDVLGAWRETLDALHGSTDPARAWREAQEAVRQATTVTLSDIEATLDFSVEQFRDAARNAEVDPDEILDDVGADDDLADRLSGLAAPARLVVFVAAIQALVYFSMSIAVDAGLQVSPQTAWLIQALLAIATWVALAESD